MLFLSAYRHVGCGYPAALKAAGRPTTQAVRLVCHVHGSLQAMMVQRILKIKPDLERLPAQVCASIANWRTKLFTKRKLDGSSSLETLALLFLKVRQDFA